MAARASRSSLLPSFAVPIRFRFARQDSITASQAPDLRRYRSCSGLRESQDLAADLFGRRVSVVLDDLERSRDPHARVHPQRREIAPGVEQVVSPSELHDRATDRGFVAHSEEPDASPLERQEVEGCDPLEGSTHPSEFADVEPGSLVHDYTDRSLAEVRA